MAGNIKGITVEIGGNATKLGETLKSIDSQASTTAKQLKAVDNALKFNPTSTQLLREKMSELQAQIQTTKDRLTELKRAEEQLSSKGNLTDSEKADLQALQTEILNTENKLKGLEAQMHEFGSVAAQQFQIVGDKMQDVGGKIEDFGQKFVGLSTAAAVGLGATAKLAMDFEDGLAKVSTVADTSAVSMDEFGAQIMEMSNRTGKSTTDLSNALYEALSAGVQTADAMDFVGNASSLATGGFTDTASAVNVLTTVLNAYGYSADQTSHISDVLIQTQNLGKITVDELASTMGRAIPTAANLGVSVDQLGAAYSIMTAKGMNARNTTTYLTSMMNEFGDSGSEVAGIIQEKTGGSFQDLMNNGGTLADALALVKEKADEDGLSLKEMFSSSEAGTAALSILGGGAEEFAATLDQVSNTAGVTDENVEKLHTTSWTLDVAMQNIKNTGTELGTTLLSALTPTLKKIVEGVKDATSWFSKLSTNTQETILKSVAFAAAIAPVTIGFGKLISNGGKAISMFASLSKMLNVNPWVLAATAIIAVVVALDDMYGTAKIVEEGQQRLTSSSQDAVEQFGLESAQAAGLTQTYGELADAVDKASQEYDTYKSTIEDTTDELESNASLLDTYYANIEQYGGRTDLTAQQQSVLQASIKGINDIIPDMNLQWDENTGALSRNIGEIEKQIDSYKRQAEAAAYQDIYTEALKGSIETQDEAVESTRVYNEARQRLVDEYGEGMVEMAEAGTLGTDLLDTQTGQWLSDLQAQRDAANDAYSGYREDMAMAEEGMAGLQESQDSSLAAWMEYFSALNEAEDSGVEFTDDAMKQISESLSSLGVATGDLAELTPEQWEEIEIATGEGTAQTLAKLEEFGVAGPETYQAALTQMGVDTEALKTQSYDQWQDVANNAGISMDQLVAYAGQCGVDAPMSMASGINTMAGQVFFASQNLSDQAIRGLGDGGGARAELLGHEFGSGYARGIAGAAGTVLDAAASIVNTAAYQTQVSQASGSPSRVARRLGTYFSQGYALGISDNEDMAADAAAAMVSAAIDNSQGDAIVALADVTTSNVRASRDAQKMQGKLVDGIEGLTTAVSNMMGTPDIYIDRTKITSAIAGPMDVALGQIAKEGTYV